MALYCSREIFIGLSGLQFPASKEEIVRYASEHDAPEAALVMLHKLDELTYNNVGEICENAHTVCARETAQILRDIQFPADKSTILEYAWSKNAPIYVIRSLELLPESVVFNSIDEVCQ